MTLALGRQEGQCGSCPQQVKFGKLPFTVVVIITDYLIHLTMALWGKYDDPLYRYGSETSVLWTPEPHSAQDRLTKKHFREAHILRVD